MEDTGKEGKEKSGSKKGEAKVRKICPTFQVWVACVIAIGCTR